MQLFQILCSVFCCPKLTHSSLIIDLQTHTHTRLEHFFPAKSYFLIAMYSSQSLISASKEGERDNFCEFTFSAWMIMVAVVIFEY